MSSMIPPERFETPRLILRRPTQDDAEALFHRWAQDEQVTRYLVWRPHRRVEESRDHIAHCARSWEEGTGFVWFLDDRDSGVLVGSVAARAGSRGVNLGYLLARDQWGKGLMVEALAPIVDWWMEQPGIFRVWATCDVNNTASARVLEKLGFQLEGILRKWERHPNIGTEPRDACCYSRIRETQPIPVPRS